MAETTLLNGTNGAAGTASETAATEHSNGAGAATKGRKQVRDAIQATGQADRPVVDDADAFFRDHASGHKHSFKHTDRNGRQLAFQAAGTPQAFTSDAVATWLKATKDVKVGLKSTVGKQELRGSAVSTGGKVLELIRPALNAK